MSSTTDTTSESPLRDPVPSATAHAEAEERQRHREEARLIRTREAAARKDTASRDGQWAAGDKTPLNPNEEYKATATPYWSASASSTCIPSGASGPFPHRTFAEGSAGGVCIPSVGQASMAARPPSLNRTNSMTSTSCSAIRSDGGQLSVAQARAIAGISTDFGRDTADVSDRQNIQLHWIRIEDVPEIFKRVEDVGLLLTEACGDTPRVILGSPVAGVAKDELIDPTPAIRVRSSIAASDSPSSPTCPASSRPRSPALASPTSSPRCRTWRCAP